jgi:hypothetical protein
MASRKYSIEKLGELWNKQNALGKGFRRAGNNKFYGDDFDSTKGTAKGFGKMIYANGDQALGYWKDGMLDSEGKEEHACVYLRAEKNWMFFFGIFDKDCVVEGRLFKDVDHKGGALNSFYGDKRVKVYTSNFWNMIMPQVWITIPLQEYVVLYAWREYFSGRNKQLEWRYYWNDNQMYYCDLEVATIREREGDMKETAEVRFKQIITERKYTITEQKIDFSGTYACIAETRLYPEGNVRKYILNQGNWQNMTVLDLLKKLPAVLEK